MASTRINDLINEGCGEIVFGTCPTQISEVQAYTDSSLFFGDRNGIRNTGCVLDGKDKFFLVKFIYLGFEGHNFI